MDGPPDSLIGNPTPTCRFYDGDELLSHAGVSPPLLPVSVVHCANVHTMHHSAVSRYTTTGRCLDTLWCLTHHRERPASRRDLLVGHSFSQAVGEKLPMGPGPSPFDNGTFLLPLSTTFTALPCFAYHDDPNRGIHGHSWRRIPGEIMATRKRDFDLLTSSVPGRLPAMPAVPRTTSTTRSTSTLCP